MTISVGMRDLARNSNILDGYDYIDVEDKKTHEYKGLFVSPKYADEFKKFLEKKIESEIQAKLDRIKTYTGKGEIHKRFNDMSGSELREKIVKEKYEE